MNEAQRFADTYSTQHGRVWAYCARRVGRQKADELTSEVFLLAWQQWPKASSRGTGWLFRTAQLLVLAELRAAKKQATIDEILTRDAAQHLGTDANAVAERLDAAAAFKRLSRQDREILLLVAWDGLTTSELAHVLQCSSAAGYVRLHRARRRLEAIEDSEHAPSKAVEDATTIPRGRRG